ncbi:MAG TPA: response regulator transcription factor [Gaiellaceae bacterium]|nr:response regulator transcription factor [Gaiellaceae bacterium]
MTSIVIADDQELVRAGFRAILETHDDLEVVGEAADGAEALEVVRRTRPDLVLMDIRMPNLDGIAATAKVAQASPSTRVLILTTFDADAYVYDAIEAGASGFLLKDVPRDELVRGVRTVARGDALLAPALTRRLLERFARLPRPGGSVAPVGDLTDRETDVLRLLARGLSNAEIGEELVVSSATVKTHVAAVLGKLGLRDRVQAVIFAYESGLVEPGGR